MNVLDEIVTGYIDNHYKEMYENEGLTISDKINHMLFRGFVQFDGDLDLIINVGSFFHDGDSIQIMPDDLDMLYEFFLQDDFLGDIIFYWETTKISPIKSSIEFIKINSKIDITHLLE